MLYDGFTCVLAYFPNPSKPSVDPDVPVDPVVSVVPVPTVLSAPVVLVVSVEVSVVLRLFTAVEPAVTTPEFCNAVIALFAAAVLEPVAPASAFAYLPVLLSFAGRRPFRP